MRFLFFVLILIAPLLIKAQYGESIRTGRPGQSIGAYVLGKSVLQLQSGYTYNHIEEDKYEASSNLFSNVLRLGLSERVELSAVLNWQQDEIKEGAFRAEFSGISSSQFGGRVHLMDNEGWRPALAFQARTSLNLNNDDYKPENVQQVFILSSVNKINDHFSFTSNWGFKNRKNNSDPLLFYTTALSYSINDKFGTFVELYGKLNPEFQSNIDGGFSYLVNSDFQLDCSVGYQGEKNRQDWFADIGFSWRTNWRK